jgi:hypothetical protein
MNGARSRSTRQTLASCEATQTFRAMSVAAATRSGASVSFRSNIESRCKSAPMMLQRSEATTNGGLPRVRFGNRHTTGPALMNPFWSQLARGLSPYVPGRAAAHHQRAHKRTRVVLAPNFFRRLTFNSQSCGTNEPTPNARPHPFDPGVAESRATSFPGATARQPEVLCFVRYRFRNRGADARLVQRGS